MRNEAGMKFDCIFEEPLDFIDIDYTHLNQTIRYAQRPHGVWIFDNITGYWYCSNCEREPKDQNNMLPFCAWCGSDNRRKEGDQNEQTTD